jgi:hypothetical protein
MIPNNLPSRVPFLYLVHEGLGAHCPAMEIKASCVGWLSGVDVAAQYLANPHNQDECILVLTGALTIIF